MPSEEPNRKFWLGFTALVRDGLIVVVMLVRLGVFGPVPDNLKIPAYTRAQARQEGWTVVF